LKTLAARLGFALFLAGLGIGIGALAMLGTDFWFLSVPVLILISAVTALRSAIFAALLSLLPLILTLVLYGANFVRYDRFTAALVASMLACVAISAFIISARLKREDLARKAARVPLTLAIVVMGIGLLIDRLFTKNIEIEKYEMSWAVGSDSIPFPLDADVEREGEPRVVLYKSVGENACYDVLYSTAVADHLRSRSTKSAIVEINWFSDFGQRRGYNVRAINGLIINDGHRPIIQTPSGGFYGRIGTLECFP
jgi:hypothetical protein